MRANKTVRVYSVRGYSALGHLEVGHVPVASVEARHEPATVTAAHLGKQKGRQPCVSTSCASLPAPQRTDTYFVALDGLVTEFGVEGPNVGQQSAAESDLAIVLGVRGHTVHWECFLQIVLLAAKDLVTSVIFIDKIKSLGLIQHDYHKAMRDLFHALIPSNSNALIRSVVRQQ